MHIFPKRKIRYNLLKILLSDVTACLQSLLFSVPMVLLVLVGSTCTKLYFLQLLIY